MTFGGGSGVARVVGYNKVEVGVGVIFGVGVVFVVGSGVFMVVIWGLGSLNTF